MCSGGVVLQENKLRRAERLDVFPSWVALKAGGGDGGSHFLTIVRDGGNGVELEYWVGRSLQDCGVVFPGLEAFEDLAEGNLADTVFDDAVEYNGYMMAYSCKELFDSSSQLVVNKALVGRLN
jgi:hypothetical protein